MQLQGYGLIMITETGWDSSYYWSTAIHGSTGQDSKEEYQALCERAEYAGSSA